MPQKEKKKGETTRRGVSKKQTAQVSSRVRRRVACLATPNDDDWTIPPAVQKHAANGIPSFPLPLMRVGGS